MQDINNDARYKNTDVKYKYCIRIKIPQVI